jgi:hypothetical protein
MQERWYVSGVLSEVAQNHLAQADDGTVYYFGVDVDVYSGGTVVGHEGTWLYGVDTDQLGVLMPANPAVGTTFQTENASGIIQHEVVSVETVTVRSGRFRDCLKIKETFADGTVELKYYARRVGVIKEVFEGGELNLIYRFADSEEHDSDDRDSDD